MTDALPSLRSHVTLALCTVLHAFTHAYGTLLVPLYLLITADLGFDRGHVWKASLIVTVYGLVYCAFSYFGGVLADRTDRKVLLGLGLVGNAVAIGLMGLTRRYELLLLLGVVAGLAGTLFHPAANALVSAHYPRAPGMAIGILGIGAGIGFFLGPQFAGWRAQAGGWHQLALSDWQIPCIEMGMAGTAVGLLFLIIAREARPRMKQAAADPVVARGAAASRPLDRGLRKRVIAVALTLACRDFAGVASVTLVSIYVQKAHGRDARVAGLLVGTMMLIGVVINPLCVWLSPGKRRLPTLAGVLIVGGLIVATTPIWPVKSILIVLCTFQACHLGSYAISDAAIMERVDAAVRGRVVGLFLTIAGTIASTAPWIMGAWTDYLGERAYKPSGYWGPFGVLGFLIAVASLTTFKIARLGEVHAEQAIRPFSETMPATMEPVG